MKKLFRSLTLATAGVLCMSGALSACGGGTAHVYELTLSETELVLVKGICALASAPITATVTEDGKVLPDAAVIYSMSDSSVATVDGGTVTAAGRGSATLTASYKGATATAGVTVRECVSREDVNTFGKQYVGLYGRTYTDGGLHLDNPATGVELSFVGNELRAEATVEGTVYVRVYVDGGEGEFRAMTTGPVCFAEGLPEGLHTVRILKASEVNVGGLVLNGFSAEQFVSPLKKSLKMEFIGDSITAGAGNLAMGGDITAENTDATTAYACRTGLALNADFSVVAVGGICLNTVFYPSLGYSMTEMHQWTSWRTKAMWEYEPDTDVVVLALGTNDTQYILQNGAYKEQFPKDYTAFLTHLRGLYKNALIVCVYGMMGRDSVVDQAIAASVKGMNDDMIVYTKDFTADNRGGAGHPCASAHLEYAETLTEYIRSLFTRFLAAQ